MSIRALKPGQPCGRYTVVGEIGRGGMAIVYLARAADGRERAIKTLQFADDLDADQQARFKLEIKVLANIDHVHVVRFFEAGRVALDRGGSLMWVALEHLRGETLRQIIDVHPDGLPAEDAARWCKQIADGVASAHALGVVHRDLKPTNVAIVHDIAKVFDFGIAKFRRWRVKSTVGNKRIGTMGYMAPEQLTGKPIDERTDVYALGLIMYELACGKHPICPHELPLTPAEIIARTIGVSQQPLTERLPHFPPALSDVAQRALAKDPDARYPDMLHMRDALERALAQHRRERRPQQMGALSGDWNVTSLGTAPDMLPAAPALEAQPQSTLTTRRRVVSILAGSLTGVVAGYGIATAFRILASLLR
jgi:serine/threonine protein kinase